MRESILTDFGLVELRTKGQKQKHEEELSDTKRHSSNTKVGVL